jgi:hypothetical protein
MSQGEERLRNEAAYRQLKPEIDQTYPKGWFVAIHEGKIAGDAATIQELHADLTKRGLLSRDVLAVQAGIDYPEYMVILAQRITT